ncbi:MAG: response regulator transcription factor [Ruminococcus sp.]|nr:response regulator transcription factor [Ruminococcus sp.]
MRILVAEDDPKLRKSLVHILESSQLLADGVGNGTEALTYAMSGNYDGIILDIMMPEMDGIEVLKAMRREGLTTPVMFLTARTEVYQRVEGLDAGADDYLPKPFSTSELLARVRAMLRRKGAYTPDLLTFRDLILNRSTYELQYGSSVQILSGKEFQIMEMLMQRPNFIIPTEQFLSHIWGWDANVEVSVVWVHISNLRKKINAVQAPFEIRFVRNAGYILGEIK